MKKLTLTALSVSMACCNVCAEDLTLAMISPTVVPQALTLANGESLASSRYAGIITPESETVRVIFDGVTEAELSAKISLDSVQFESNEQFSGFLKSVGISDNYLEKILKQNSGGGFAHSESCKGARSECVVISKGIDLVIADKTKDMSWLPRKEAVVCWAWDYVRKLPYFRKKSMSSWFQPVNVAEKRMAVIAVFDESFPDEYMYRHDFIKYRNHLIANMKAAYDKKMGNKNDKLRTQISVKISWHAKQRLDKLMRDRGATQQSIIEYLLLHGNLD